MDPYASIAALYAIDFADVRDDVDFYRSLARTTRGPIVEFMCGGGRVAVPLAADGHTVTGVDLSAAMLAHIPDHPLYRPDLKLDTVCADMCTWETDTRYGLAIVALNSFMHLQETSEHIAALQRAYRALRPGGTLVIDLFNPDMRHLPDYRGDTVLDKQFALPDGRTVQKFVAQWSDVAAQKIHVVFLYDINGSERFQRVSASFSMRYFWRFELEHLLARCGFSLDAVYGDYELTPYQSDSEQLVVVATRDKRR
jgi:SAM-dependent methyltransferase